jgi:hypothetical protein
MGPPLDDEDDAAVLPALLTPLLDALLAPPAPPLEPLLALLTPIPPVVEELPTGAPPAPPLLETPTPEEAPPVPLVPLMVFDWQALPPRSATRRPPRRAVWNIDSIEQMDRLSKEGMRDSPGVLGAPPALSGHPGQSGSFSSCRFQENVFA